MRFRQRMAPHEQLQQTGISCQARRLNERRGRNNPGPSISMKGRPYTPPHAKVRSARSTITAPSASLLPTSLPACASVNASVMQADNSREYAVRCGGTPATASGPLVGPLDIASMPWRRPVRRGQVGLLSPMPRRLSSRGVYRSQHRRLDCNRQLTRAAWLQVRRRTLRRQPGRRWRRQSRPTPPRRKREL